MRCIITAMVVALAITPTLANETVVRHSSGVFTLTMPDGWGWRETPGPFPNGDGASVGGEGLFQIIVPPATTDNVDMQAMLYLPLVQRRWFDAAVSGRPHGTQVGRAPAAIYRLVFKDQGQLWELRTIFFCRGGNVIIGVMRTAPELAAKYESSLREILDTVSVRPNAPPSSPPPPAAPALTSAGVTAPVMPPMPATPAYPPAPAAGAAAAMPPPGNAFAAMSNMLQSASAPPTMKPPANLPPSASSTATAPPPALLPVPTRNVSPAPPVTGNPFAAMSNLLNRAGATGPATAPPPAGKPTLPPAY